jgi:hypothetical protein
MDDRQDIDGAGKGSIDELLTPYDSPHPPQQRLFIAAVVEEGEVLVTGQQVQEGVERSGLLVRAVRPE